MLSLFDFRHPHERALDLINTHLQVKELSHLVICYGGINGQEINDEIQALIAKARWNIEVLQGEKYWNLFARHVTTIRLEAHYFTERDYSLLLSRVKQVTEWILFQQSGKHERAPVAAGTLRSVHFGKEGETPQKFGWWKRRCRYNDAEVVNWLKCFQSFSLQEVTINHSITLHFFEQLIAPLRGLKRLKSSRGYIYSQFHPEKGFEFQPLISRQTLFTCLSRLPRSIVYLDLGIAFLAREIEFLAAQFPSLENLSVSGDADQALAPIGKLTSLTSLSLDSCFHCSEHQFAHLANCTRLTSVTIYSGSPSLSVLSLHLPATVTELHVRSFAPFALPHFSSLKRFPLLRHLTLHGMHEPAQLWIEDLTRHNPLLKTLDLERCHMTEREVRFLHFEFPSLVSLVLGNRHSKDVFHRLNFSVEAFRSRRPKVRVKFLFDESAVRR